MVMNIKVAFGVVGYAVGVEGMIASIFICQHEHREVVRHSM
jgi:hypothetical protein